MPIGRTSWGGSPNKVFNDDSREGISEGKVSFEKTPNVGLKPHFGRISRDPTYSKNKDEKGSAAEPGEGECNQVGGTRFRSAEGVF